MDVPSLELNTESKSETYPLLMEHPENRNRSDHVIDIRSNEASTSSLHHDRGSDGLDTLQNEDRSLSSRVSQPPIPSTNGLSTRASSTGRRGDARRRRSPLNSGLWISTELVLTVSQIIASIVVLSISRDEHPQAPLFVWVVGYTIGCVATLPLLYWRYRNRNQVSEQDSAQQRQGTAQINVPAGPFSLSVSRPSEGDDRRGTSASPRTSQNGRTLSSRLKSLMEYFKMGLDCFFAIWFVVGNVWIFGGHSSAEEAPNIYRLCIVFLSFSCIGYAMPFILCATICCCLPCIISILGFREDLSRTRGATTEAINALPTFKFKLRKSRSGNEREGAGDGGLVAAGTERERFISGEDAVCCICLAKYANNDELRELQCSHFFHKECIDKWLKINALCPLCKSEVTTSANGQGTASDAN